MSTSLRTFLQRLAATAPVALLGAASLANAQNVPASPAPADVPAAAKDAANDVGNAAKNAAQEVKQETKEAAQDTRDAAREAAKDARDTTKEVRDAARDTTKDAREATKEAREATRDTVRDPRDPRNPANDASRDLRGAAQDTVRDAREAVRDTRDAARDTVRDARDAARDTVRDARDVRADFRVEGTRAADFGIWFNRGGNDGLVIADVATRGAVAKLGFREGDRIVSVNGQRITAEADFVRYLLADDVRNDRVKVIIIRDGREEVVMVEPAVIIDEIAYVENDPLENFGIIVDDRYTDRIVVWRVVPRSPAFYAGIRAGDVLVSLGDQRLTGVRNLVQRLTDIDAGNVQVQINRGQATRTIDVDLPRFVARTERRTSLRPNFDAVERREDRLDRREERIEDRLDRRDARPVPAPGVRGGVEVQAPGVNIRTPGAAPAAPGAPAGVEVQAPGVNIQAPAPATTPAPRVNAPAPRPGLFPRNR
jgi:C-terminal processing protease CtpA/Prc